MPRILVLEDQTMISIMVEEWLLELSCEPVGPAASVERALELIETNALDGAILDVSLNGEDCYRVAERLRDRGVPFAFATGHGSGGIAEGFKDFPVLAKPFDFEMVQAAVAAMVQARPVP
jgi:CheY-like chemotaxis protein